MQMVNNMVFYRAKFWHSCMVEDDFYQCEE